MSIGYSAFKDCTGLTKINWNAEGVSDFKYYNDVFSNAGTAGDGIDVVFGDNLKSIPSYLFYSSNSEYETPNIKSVTIGNSVTSIGSSAFRDCTDLTTVTIPDSVTSIGISAFDGTAWYVAQPFGDVYAGKVYYKYKGTMLENTSVEIKNGTKGIAGGAFSNCNGLVNITIPNSVTNIGESAFENCDGLTEVTIPGSVKTIGDSAFEKTNYNYRGLKKVMLEKGVETIGNRAFSGCGSLRNIEIPNSVTSIGIYAFSNCYSLTDIEIPDSVTSIGNYAFSYCGSLTSIHIPGSVKIIGDYAFSGGCYALKTVIFDEGIETIGYRAFASTAINQIVIPDSVTSLGGGAFSDCGSLTSVTIGSGIQTVLGYYTFDWESASYCTFKNCPNLTTIKIKKGVKSIEKGAFNGIKSIPDVFFEGSEEEWKEISIDQSNDMILRANMHYNADLSHEHSYTETVKKATCTEDGLKTFTCSCGRTYSEKIPAIGHNYQSVIVEPTCVSIGYETSTCENCGESYFIRPIPAMGHRDWDGDGFCDVCSRKMSEVEKPDTKETADEKTGVTVEYPNGTFSGNVKLNAETVTEGKIFEIVSGEKGNFKRTVYSITTSVNGREAQPNGTVSVKIPLPEGYDGEKTNVYYVSEEGTLEKLECRTENGYVIFETDHFSYYAVVDESENGVTPENCSCACHKKGIAKFFFKIGLIFQKIFKKNKICKCGVWHY